MRKLLIINYSLLIILSSCSVQNKIGKTANKILLKDSSLINAHLGISIYDPATGKYLYNYQGDKYFVPASNTKLFACYAAMKYLGDSLKGIEYHDQDTAIVIVPTGDPSFLHSDFSNHPVLNFFKAEERKLYITKENWKEKALGFGWAWDDYNSEYMVERSPMPAYGNVARFSVKQFNPERAQHYTDITWNAVPHYFRGYTDSFNLLADRTIAGLKSPDSSLIKKFFLQRRRESNFFKLIPSLSRFAPQEIPFFSDTLKTVLAILQNDHKVNISDNYVPVDNTQRFDFPKRSVRHFIKSQPTDSVLLPMMHRSDNFFAEQMLLMVSNEKLGYMNDGAIIETILKTELKDAPQKPKWVDGSGLSRYNLFTPQDFVYILNKMKSEFGLERLKIILPTGGEGTIRSYYQNLAGQIFAKTGTLSNNCALSGFLITKSGKLLIFSILANNYQTSATPVRKAVEKFLNRVRDNY